jgi:hypothetical protein
MTLAKILVIFCAIFCSLESVLVVTFLLRRHCKILKHRHTSVKGYKEMYMLMSVSFITIVSSILQSIIYFYPNQSMQFNASLTINATCLISAWLIVVWLYRIFVQLRVIGSSNFFFTCIFECLNNFLAFIIVYMTLLIVFSRMMFSTFNAAQRMENKTVEDVGLSGKSASDLWVSTYWMFQLLLNVIPDLSSYRPTENFAVANILHVFFVFLMPIFFVNFIVAILSSQFSYVKVYFDEYECMNRIQTIMYVDCITELLNSVLSRKFGSSSFSITFCDLLQPQPMKTDILESKTQLESLETNDEI